MKVDELELQALVEGGSISYGIVQPGTDGELGVPIVRVGDLEHGSLAGVEPKMRVDPAIEARFHKTRLRGGEVLVSLVGAAGRTAVVPSTLAGWNVARAVAVLRPVGVEPRWLAYALAGPSCQRQIFAALNTTVQATLNLSDLKTVRVPMPASASRRAIAEVLGALDDKIAANQRADLLAATLAETIFDRASSVAGATEMALWEAVSVTFGEPFAGSQFSEPGVGRPLIRIRDLKTQRCQVWTTEERSAETVIRAGDVVAGMDAEFRPSYWLGGDGVLNQRCLVADSRFGGKAFALEALKAPLARIEGSKSATTVIHLNKSDLLRETVIVPEETQLRRFSEIAEPLRLRRVAIASESLHLAELRDTLLPHLMSGRLTVREAEKQVEAAL